MMPDNHRLYFHEYLFGNSGGWWFLACTQLVTMLGASRFRIKEFQYMRDGRGSNIVVNYTDTLHDRSIIDVETIRDIRRLMVTREDGIEKSEDDTMGRDDMIGSMEASVAHELLDMVRDGDKMAVIEAGIIQVLGSAKYDEFISRLDH